ncbi:MAG: class III extradiol ring-cleavage dioxygenase [Desulfovibrio sp.]
MDLRPGTKNRVLSISHGAGPLPVLGDSGHVEMVANLRHLAATLPKPSAIVLVSAHWEQPQPTITSGLRPPLEYDYSGFPQAAYELEYPAPGLPALERDLQRVLAEAGFSCGRETQRGFDHGMFIPLMLMYPEADVPCVQLSLIRGLDPAEHLRMGAALAGLEQENLLIVGSGFSFHNMRAFFTPDTDQTRAQNLAFDAWLRETCAGTMDEAERKRRLIHWESVPHARYCHPREEHLLPLHVCYGAAGRACRDVFELTILGKKASAFLW